MIFAIFSRQPGQPVTWLATEPAGQPVARPAGQPASRAAGQPGSRSAGHPASQPTRQLAGRRSGHRALAPEQPDSRRAQRAETVMNIYGLASGPNRNGDEYKRSGGQCEARRHRPRTPEQPASRRAQRAETVMNILGRRAERAETVMNISDPAGEGSLAGDDF